MSKCNHDCFNCQYPDCVIETISPEERKEINERDKRYFTPVATRVVIQRANRARQKGCRVI